MVINHLEKLFVTNDAATIIRELEVSYWGVCILEFCFSYVDSSISFHFSLLSSLQVLKLFC